MVKRKTQRQELNAHCGVPFYTPGLEVVVDSHGGDDSPFVEGEGRERNERKRIWEKRRDRERVDDSGRIYKILIIIYYHLIFE